MKRVACVLLLLATAAHAQVFKWTDAQGKVHYGDQPPQDAKATGVKTPDAKVPGLAREAPSADVIVSPPQIDAYQVGGIALGDLLQAMHQAAPKGEEGYPVWGKALWNVGWELRYDASIGCRIETFKITVSTRFQMPEWIDRGRAPGALQDKWGAFYRALLLHEEGHRDNGVRAANELARRFRALPKSSDCKALEAEVRDLGERVTREYNQADREYDRSTRHGETQGATLR